MTSIAWPERKLGDVVTLKRGYDLPVQDRRPGGFPIVSSSGVTGFHAVPKVKGPGVVTGRYGTLGEVFYIREDFWPLNTSLYVQDFKGNDPRFVAYFLGHLDLASRNAAGAVPGVNRNHLHAMTVHVPCVPEQRRIAAVLAAYDDLVDNNLQRVRIIEDMSHAIYREWFTASRANDPSGRSVHSNVTSLPNGWSRSDLATVCSGKAGIQTGPFGSQLHQSEYADEGIPVVMPKDLVGFRIDTQSIARVPPSVADRLARHKTKPGDILYGRRGDIGRRAFVMPSQAGWLCGTGCLRLRPDGGRVNSWFLFNYLGEADVVRLIAGRAHGVTLPNLNAGLMASVPVLLPSRALQDRFEEVTLPMAQLIETLLHQNVVLDQTRELLLPRLLSGQLRLAEVEDNSGLVAESATVRPG
jgi:type I restriction enzyme, S subunit